MKTITFYFEDDNNEDVDFNGETLDFALKMIKIWTVNGSFKNWNVLVIVSKTLLWDKKHCWWDNV